MPNFKLYFKPNGMKVLLTILILIPSWLIMGFISFGNLLIMLLGGIVIAYIAGCALDTFIKSKPVKICIAIIATAITLWISIKLFSYGTVSEYAHIPSECELACREIYENATNRTAEVMQKFQECMQNCYK